MLSRTGYSGERGYELFMGADVVVDVWQELMQRGQAFGLRPISFGGLEMVHIESGLMAYGAEATEQNTPWEVDMGWAVSRNKGDFRGKQALFELEGKEKVKFFGIVAEHDDVVEHGAELSIDGADSRSRHYPGLLAAPRKISGAGTSASVRRRGGNLAGTARADHTMQRHGNPHPLRRPRAQATPRDVNSASGPVVYCRRQFGPVYCDDTELAKISDWIPKW